MALLPIAVQGMAVIVDPTSPSPAGAVVATIVAAAPTGTKCRASALMHRDGDQITVTAITVPSAGATIADPGPYTVPLNATAVKSKAQGLVVLRTGDVSDVIEATPQIPGSPPSEYPVSFRCIISNANQTKALAR